MFLYCYENEAEGLAAKLYRTADNRIQVVMLDTDANETYQVTIYPELGAAIDSARAFCQM